MTVPADRPTHPWTRRGLLKAAAATPFIAGLPMASGAGYWAAGSDRLRVGLVGCGGRGTGAALQALNADPGAVLVAVGDVFADRVKTGLDAITEELGDRAADKLDVPESRRFVGFDAYKHVLAQDIDVILLCGYPNSRPEQLRAAVDAGKHIFAEKPVAVDAAGIRSVIESSQLASSKGLSLLVGFCWRHCNGMRIAFDKILSGGVGKITAAYTNYLGGTLNKRPRKPEWSDLEFQMRNWWHFTWISGDHIVEQAVHSVDRLAWAMGDRPPLRATALGGRAARSGPEHGNVYDHFSVVYDYDHGVKGYHNCRQIDGTPADNSDYIHGTAGSAFVNGWQPAYRIQGHDGSLTWEHKADKSEIAGMYQNEHDLLFKAIRDGKPYNDGVRSAQSCLMAIMGRMAAYTGQTVTWDQALNSKEDLQPKRVEWGPFPTPEIAVPGKTPLI